MTREDKPQQPSPSAIRPVHLAIAAGAIVIAVVAAPFVKDRWAEAHPDPDTLAGRYFYRCVEKGVSRWDSDRMSGCKALEMIRDRY